MNKKEVLKIVRKIEMVYNHPWTGKSFIDLKKSGVVDAETTAEQWLLEVVNAWHEIIGDYDFEEVDKLLIKYIKNGGKFPPKPGELLPSAGWRVNKEHNDYMESIRGKIEYDDPFDF